MVSESYKRERGLTADQIAGTMKGFYARVDAACAGILSALAASGHALRCRRGCCDCCLDGLSVTFCEASVIEADYGGVLDGEPHAPGACAFLDDGGSCRIYEARPYICRTHGLPLRWREEGQDGECRDICEHNGEGIAVDALKPEQCWTVGVAELQLQCMEDIVFGSRGRRPLRALFRKAGSSNADTEGSAG
ncbi:MAG: YkgJ family cysteine cluster protein, partial [Proteobacteria bacterium]|nr:YkgJ family cysteine cluster protein [Pseudomonadota bacterium]